MRILFSAGFFPSENHPFTSFIGDMAKAMVKNGHEVTVLAPQSITKNLIRGGDLLPIHEKVSVETENGGRKSITVYRPKVFTIGDRWKILGKVTFFLRKWGCNRVLNKHKGNFDVVYSHFWECGYNVSDYVRSEILPMIVVSGEDEIVLNKYLTAKQLNRLESITKRVICVSGKNRDESIECGLCKAADCEVIPNGADMSKFHPMSRDLARKQIGLDNNSFIISFVGRFIERKGAMRIIKALEKLSDSDIKGIFIGKSFGDSTQEPTGEYVAFKGVVPHDKIPVYLNASDVYVLPTLAEGCSNSIVEAMACGLPIISSDMPFNYDILDSSNSILISPRDVDGIALAIKGLKDAPQLRASMGMESFVKAQELSFEKRVYKILCIIEQVVEDN